MTEESRFDVGFGEVGGWGKKDVGGEEDHCTGEVVRGALEEGEGFAFGGSEDILGVEGDAEGEDVVGEVGGTGAGVWVSDFFAGHYDRKTNK